MTLDEVPRELLLVLDLLGVLVFAASGATLAAVRRLDVFGVLTLGVVTALGGGVVRDLLIGVPPAAVRDDRYLAAALAGGVLAFFAAEQLARLGASVVALDAAGLGLFVAASTSKALDAGLGAAPAMAIGCLTGVGGGLVRDVLLSSVPEVLHREVYAVPALLGAGVVTAGDGLDAERGPVSLAAILLVLVVRLVAVRRGWRAPMARIARRAQPDG